MMIVTLLHARNWLVLLLFPLLLLAAEIEYGLLRTQADETPTAEEPETASA